MFYRLAFALSLVVVLVGCGAKTLTLAEVRDAGFQVTQEKAFMMVGAVDGAGGRWSNGESVEVYVYDKSGGVPESARQMFPGPFYSTTREHMNLLIVCNTDVTCDQIVDRLD